MLAGVGTVLATSIAIAGVLWVGASVGLAILSGRVVGEGGGLAVLLAWVGGTVLATLIAIAVWEVLWVGAGVGLAILSGRVVGTGLVILRVVWVGEGLAILLAVGRGLVLWSALAGWLAGLVPALFRLLGPVWVGSCSARSGCSAWSLSESVPL